MPIHSLNQTWLAISWIIDSFWTPAYCWLGSGFKVTGDLQKAIRLGVVFFKFNHRQNQIFGNNFNV